MFVMAPNGSGAQLHPTALTANAGAHAPAARILPRIDWSELLGVSCSALLGGAPFVLHAQADRSDVEKPRNGKDRDVEIPTA